MVALHGYTSSGPANELMEKNGLTPAGVEKAVLQVLKRKRG
jgi:transketolase